MLNKLRLHRCEGIWFNQHFNFWKEMIGFQYLLPWPLRRELLQKLANFTGLCQAKGVTQK